MIIIKKTSTAMMLLLISICFLSCTQKKTSLEEETCVGDNYPITLNKYIKKITRTTVPSKYKIQTTHTSEFTYNEFNLLAKQRSYTYAYDNEYLFNYQCHNNVSDMYGEIYKYNSDEKIISVKSNSGPTLYDLTYNDQTVLVKGTINYDFDKEITLMLNSSNKVRKISRIDSYSTFDYDPNDNLTRIKDFNLKGELLNEYEIIYDQNPNPFYGQLKSVYLVSFIELFGQMNRNLSSLVIYDYDSRIYSYFKNNVIGIKEITNPTSYKFFFEREFTYDAQNYPIKIKSSFAGLYDNDYKIEYK